MAALRWMVAAGASAAAAGLAAYVWWRRSRPRSPFLDNPAGSDPPKPMVLRSKHQLSHDTWRLVFELDAPDQPLGLPVGGHLMLSCPPPGPPAVEGEWNGRSDPEAWAELVHLKYTPTSRVGVLGCVELVVKLYMPNDRWADGGKMSRYLAGLQEQDQVMVKGPLGGIRYHGRGSFTVHGKQLECSRIGMIAGGTGITPMLQILQAIADDPTDSTEVGLLFGNQSPGDILLRSELDELQSGSLSRFKIWHTVDRPDSQWPPAEQRQQPERLSTGFVDQDKIRAVLPPPEVDGQATVVLMCGPPPMLKSCKQQLKALGYQAIHMF